MHVQSNVKASAILTWGHDATNDGRDCVGCCIPGAGRGGIHLVVWFHASSLFTPCFLYANCATRRNRAYYSGYSYNKQLDGSPILSAKYSNVVRFLHRLLGTNIQQAASTAMNNQDESGQHLCFGGFSHLR